jgi:Rad3-related DNA helicase
MNIYELVDDRYVIYSEHGETGEFRIKLYCVDPSKNLQERIDKGNAAIFFSATLLPIHYYKSLLSTQKDNYAVYAESAFSEKQRLLLLGSDVSSKYTRRNQVEFEKIAGYLAKTVQAKKGNYMAFFPSYKMMEQVYEVYETQYGGLAACVLQQSGMKEEEREAFLEAFDEKVSAGREKSLLAFCVMGGIFGEGIDLKNEQLIGAVIVGTGLPQISNEREILMNYYEKRSGEGFDYAYRYPGMNKVLQAGGRVIRTAEDVGVILLLDDRFLQSDYRNLFPREWEQRSICNLGNVKEKLGEFWQQL